MSVYKIRHKLFLSLFSYLSYIKKKKKERRGNIVISDKNLYSKNVQEPTLFARGGEKMRLQPGNCNRLSLIHAFQYSYYKTIRNINVSLCIEVTNVIYTDIPVP